MYLSAEAVQHACDFNSDITCACDSDAFGQMSQFKKTIRIDTVLCAWDIRENRMTARRNQNMVSSDLLAIDLNRIGIDEFSKALSG